MLEPTARAACRHWHPALDVDLFATSAVPHAAEPATEPPHAAAVATVAGVISDALERILAEVLALPPINLDQDFPAFLLAPSPEYLATIERGFV